MLIEQSEHEREELRAQLEARDRMLSEREQEIASLQSKMKKRTREEFEGVQVNVVPPSSEDNQNAKKFRPNPPPEAPYVTQGSGQSCQSSSNKYHKLCKLPACCPPQTGKTTFLLKFELVEGEKFKFVRPKG